MRDNEEIINFGGRDEEILKGKSNIYRKGNSSYIGFMGFFLFCWTANIFCFVLCKLTKLLKCILIKLF